MTDPKPTLWLVKFNGKPIGLHWHEDLAYQSAAPIEGAVVVPLIEQPEELTFSPDKFRPRTAESARKEAA